MLLQRVIKHVKAQNWTAVALDFVIVVMGVFMGLQVQQWSAARADRDAEEIALQRLIVEYEKNLQILAADKEMASRTMTASQTLLSIIAPEPDPGITDEFIARPLLDCLGSAKFVPALGVTDSLTSSGEIRLIGDPEIQRMLSQWPTKAQKMIEWQEIERVHGEELIADLTYDYLSWPSILCRLNICVSSGELESDYAGLFSSKRFQGMLYNRWLNTKNTIRQAEDLEAATHELINRMRRRLDALQ